MNPPGEDPLRISRLHGWLFGHGAQRCRAELRRVGVLRQVLRRQGRCCGAVRGEWGEVHPEGMQLEHHHLFSTQVPWSEMIFGDLVIVLSL